MTLNTRYRLLPLLLLGFLVRPAFAAPPTFAEKVAAIEAAQTAELTRLNAVIVAAAGPVEVLPLQRCAVHVKLLSRIALHTVQLEITTDEALRATLTRLIEELNTQLAAGRDLLPATYTFDPLAALAVLAPEVPPCTE